MKKLAIVTGAGSGIGQATAVLFNQHKWDVFLIGRDQNKLEQTKSLCNPTLAGIHYESCDVSQEPQVKAISQKIASLKVDSIALINNAGIFRGHQLGDGGSEIWNSHFKVNLFGAVFMFQNILPLMKEGQPHSIVNVSSTLGLRPTADTSAYSASKAALNNWTQSLALGLGSRQIRVNCVCPGLVDTPIHEFHSRPPEKKSNALAKLAPLQPLGRIGTSEEIAKSIYFLASDESPWTTGAILSVDGGINLT